jgi:serine/threonine protein kinase
MAQQGDQGPPAPPLGRTMSAWHPPSSASQSITAVNRPRPVEALASAPAQAPAPAASTYQGPLFLGVGSVIGNRYVIEQSISSGGFGAVYRATDREIRHHQVALKLLHRPSASEEERESALRELMLIASVSHPSVVQFKDYGWHEGRLWFAMPWYEGQTLDRVLRSQGSEPMSRADAQPIFTRIAQGLAAMHAVGVHHHDIKPENIFLAEIAGFPGGLPVLLDLGISTRRGENPKGLTVEFASPETAAAILGEGTKPIGAAADVFSLALVLRNALDPSLASPVITEHVIPILHQRATQPVELPQRSDLKFMEPYFRRWLSHHPEDRPSAAELAEEFVILTEPERQQEARRRLLKRVVPIVSVAMVLIAALVWRVREQGSALHARQQELAEERKEGEELRKQSEAQLAQLELASQKLGNERQQLTQALSAARRLNGQLAQSTQRVTALNQRVGKLRDEVDGLEGDKQALTQERDDLQKAKQSLTAERSQLIGQRDALRSDNAQLARERDGLERERARLAGERTELIAARDALDKQIAGLTRERDRLQTESTASNDKLEKALRVRDEAIVRRAELETQLEKLEAENKRLEQQLRAARAGAPPGASQPTEEAPAPASPSRPREVPRRPPSKLRRVPIP